MPQMREGPDTWRVCQTRRRVESRLLSLCISLVSQPSAGASDVSILHVSHEPHIKRVTVNTLKHVSWPPLALPLSPWRPCGGPV